MKILAALMAAGLLVGCAGTSFQFGVGYRKIPLVPEERERLSLSPEQIEKLLDILGPETMAVLFPPDNRVDLGLWIGMEIEK